MNRWVKGAVIFMAGIVPVMAWVENHAARKREAAIYSCGFSDGIKPASTAVRFELRYCKGLRDNAIAHGLAVAK